MELTIMQAGKKNLQMQYATEDSRNNGEYFKISCNYKSKRDWMYERKVYVVIHVDSSVIAN